jgi:outer membrane lipoprotein-sorting protein
MRQGVTPRAAAPSPTGLPRRLALLALLAVSACAGRQRPVLTADQQTSLAEVQTYLDGLQAFHARFSQTGSDGPAAGVLWLDRPGRLRVEYLSPSPKLLVTNNGRLLLADQTTGATTTMPVSKTPLDILLAGKIALTGGPVTVESVQRQPGAMQIALIKTGQPGAGRLTLQFATSPLALSSVVVQDASGHTNELHLYGLYRDSTIDPSLFHYHPPVPPAG